MKVALLGMRQSGKSTLFAAIGGRVPATHGQLETDTAIVPVPDERLDWLTALYRPKKTVHASIEVLDLTGLDFCEEISRKESRRLLAQTRTVDMFVLVVRAFDSKSVPPYRGTVDPLRDLQELQQELLLTDLELVLTRSEKLEKQLLKVGKDQARDREELELQRKLQVALEEGRPVRAVLSTPREIELSLTFGFYTAKPILAVVNIDEEQLSAPPDLSCGIDSSITVLPLCAKIEYELSQLDVESRRAFMQDIGISESAAQKFVRSCYETLGLISFLTVGEDEVRAWPIKRGMTALEAAGKIHSDMKRGFIRAETMSYAELREAGNQKALKAAGRIRLEGKEYIVQDGDIIDFRFNV